MVRSHPPLVTLQIQTTRAVGNVLSVRLGHNRSHLWPSNPIRGSAQRAAITTRSDPTRHTSSMEALPAACLTWFVAHIFKADGATFTVGHGIILLGAVLFVGHSVVG
jgi:hypothetical protein